MKIQIIFVVVLCAITADAFSHRRSERVKRSPDDDGVISKIKSGVGSFVGGVKNFGVKGYEEVKNLFSKNRRVGDYRLNQIDVRFGDEETTTTTSDETVAIDEENVENNPEVRQKREAKKEEQVVEHEVSDIQMKTLIDDQVLSQSSGIEGESNCK